MKDTSFSTSAASSTNNETKININKNKALAQYGADAGILAEFEESGMSGKSFDYSKSVVDPPRSVSEDKMIAYLSKIQRGGLTQPFGCMITIEEPSFRIIGFSENCFQLLGLEGKQFDSKQFTGGLIGVDATTLFTPTSGASLAKAVASREISLLNPVWVYARETQKPFYAILHRIDVGVVIDLEPARSSDLALSFAGQYSYQS